MLSRICFSLFLVVGVLFNLIGQQQSIIVKSAETKEPLIGVGVVNLKDNHAYITDQTGAFTLNVSTFPIQLKFDYVGYQTLIINYSDFDNIDSDIFLNEVPTILDAVVVTGSKYEQNIVRSPVSIDIIKSDLVSSINSTSADEVLNKIPGVQVLDGQANIRGGSGYSYGAGSRVMLLIDDIPALQPDAGFPNWSDIPIENLSQIEILKGAASTLYGSAALNGIINFRSAYAKSTPETQISTGGTLFLSPADPDKKWWGDSARYEMNVSFVHKQKFGKLDMIASGFYNKLESTNQFTNHSKGRGNLQFRYRLSDNLIFNLGGIINVGTNSSFFLWENGQGGATRAFPGTVTERMAKRIYIDPGVTYYDKYTNKHRIMARSMIIDNNNDNNQSNHSTNHYVEYQFQRDFIPAGLIFTTGVVGQWSNTNSELLGDTTFRSQNYALYLQADKTITSKLTLAGGLRYEYIQQNSPEFFFKDTIPGGKVTNDQVVARISANYQVAEYSALRGSLGQGYRYPTLTERFVTTTFGVFSIFSNPHLLPETGWSAELGYKQGFAIGGFKGFLDLATFVSEYKDMIEFTFLGPQDLGIPAFGFKPLNIGDTHISGYEVGITGQLKIGTIPVTLFGGYTYIDPYYKNFADSRLIQSTISEHKDSLNVLKYRSKHQIKMDVEATFNNFKWGISYQYASHFLNIDRAFEDPLPGILENPDLFGIQAFRNSHNSGYHLLDMRFSYDFHKLKCTFLINNVLNQEYSLRPALLEAPRNIGLRLDYKLS
ncbi:MAG: TonB-dependent receptor [Chitinophagales bacterium]|nr:TonB-dependent receptor [Chitinophagales bacterium]